MAVDYTDKIINYFSHNFHFHNKPLYGHDDLITTLNNEYQKNIMNLSIIIEEKNKEQQVITNEVEKINKISTIEITGKIYYKLNQQFDWAFIKKQFAEIKIINKNLIDDLFANEEIRNIRSENELFHLQYSKDFLFLFDYTLRLKELNNLKKVNQEIIQAKEVDIKLIKLEIKKELECYFTEKIREVCMQINSFSNNKTKLNDELNKKQSELILIEN